MSTNSLNIQEIKQATQFNKNTSSAYLSLGKKLNSDCPHEYVHLTRKELCVLLGTTMSWAEYRAWKGDGPPITRLNRRSVRYRLSDVLQWLAQFQNSKQQGV